MKARHNWKTLERHPLSEEYADLSGRAWELFLQNLRQNGIVGNHKVILYESKVIDGWQLYRGCIQLGIKPRFETLKLPKGMTIEEYVATVNDHRRHETQEQATKRIEERRQRAVAARQNGQSYRAIGKDEGVSEKTVRKDLKKSGADGSAPDFVNGQDGKTYPSSKQTTAEPETNIPERLKPFFESVPMFDETARLAERLADRLRAIEKTPAYRKAVEDKKHRDYSNDVRTCARFIRSIAPKQPCPECGGEYEPSLENDPCKTCMGRGYQTAEEIKE